MCLTKFDLDLWWRGGTDTECSARHIGVEVNTRLLQTYLMHPKLAHARLLEKTRLNATFT